MKGKRRIRGPSVIKHWTEKLDFSFEKINSCVKLRHPILSLFIWYSWIGETVFGTPGKYVEPQGSRIFEGMSKVEQFQKNGTGQKLIFLAKFTLGQFYVAKTRSNGRIFSGQILGKYN